ncbi:hypothetical protein Ancab_013868 [Ancistrocladus abbreviatus]
MLLGSRNGSVGFVKPPVKMALVSRGGSRLNPNAPLYIPAALRQVEDFSPEWWDLITTSMWFRDYWLSQHQEADVFHGNYADTFDGDDIVDLLPDDIDVGVDEDVLNMESQFEEFIKSTGNKGINIYPKTDGEASSNSSLFSGAKLSVEPVNNQEKPDNARTKPAR